MLGKKKIFCFLIGSGVPEMRKYKKRQGSFTSQSPGAGPFLRVPAVEDQVGVVARPVVRAKLQEGSQLGEQGLQRDAAGGVVAAERLDHVVGEEALHVVEHPCGAQVELLHLVRWQESGLAIGAGQKTERGEGGGKARSFLCSSTRRETGVNVSAARLEASKQEMNE